MAKGFQFEENFDPLENQKWMSQNWQVSVWCSLVYLIVIFGLQRFMRDRTRYDLRNALILWNAFLAVFSLCGALRYIPEVYEYVIKNGFGKSLCEPMYVESRICGFWGWWFTWFKLVEYGDTLFIVLRKNKLIFLHWYHHIVVSWFTFYTIGNFTAMVIWFVMINYIIHSIMYTYFAITAAKIRLPKSLAMLVTTLQILQMVAGCYIIAAAYSRYDGNNKCQISTWTTFLGLTMYVSFFVFFVKLFAEKYFKGGPKKVMQEINNNSKSK